MRIRPAAEIDADGLVDLERALILAGSGMVQSPEQVPTREEMVRRIASVEGASLVLVAEIDRRIAGHAGLKQLQPKRCAHVGVLWVGVHPDFHRRGIGRALMQALIDHAIQNDLKRLELYVRSDNDKAQALYRSLGFRHEGTRVRFVAMDDGSFIDDYIMVRFL